MTAFGENVFVSQAVERVLVIARQRVDGFGKAQVGQIGRTVPVRVVVGRQVLLGADASATAAQRGTFLVERHRYHALHLEIHYKPPQIITFKFLDIQDLVRFNIVISYKI